MNETIMMSIGGYAFTMDSEAADAASEYIASLESFYLPKEDGKEIMEGIEERMAELLLEKTNGGAVVNSVMVNEIIEVLGRPEAIEEESARASGFREGGPSAAGEESKASPRKKLYRDMSDRVFAGVCSGLAIYTNIDVVLLRLAFALMTLFPVFGRHHSPLYLSPILLYIVLWISMPAAKTVRQRLDQKGQTGSIEEIQRNVMSNPKRNVPEEPRGHGLARVIGIIVGTILLVTAVSGLVAGSVATFFPVKFGLDWVYGQSILELGDVPGIAQVLQMPVVRMLAICSWFLPFIGLLYAAVMMIFGLKAPKWHPGLVIFILWLISIVALVTLVATSAIQYGI